MVLPLRLVPVVVGRADQRVLVVGSGVDQDHEGRRQYRHAREDSGRHRTWCKTCLPKQRDVPKEMGGSGELLPE
jgi:hypothetical protein